MDTTDTARGAAAAMLDPAILAAGPRRHGPQARSPADGPQPRHVRGRGRGRADHGAAVARPGHSAARDSASPCRSCSGCGSPCCSPTSPRRWPRAAARRRPRRCARPAPRRRPSACAASGKEPGTRSPPRRSRSDDLVLVGDQRPDPQRRRGGRRHRLGRRVGDHRRVRPGDPRKRRRPLGGHRRHPRAVGPDHRAHHRGPGLDLHRPHDRAGGGRHAGRRRRTRSRSTSCSSA